MPRLPGPADLGALPSMRPSGSPAQISGSSPVAEGLGRVGQQMVSLSNEQREKDDSIQLAEADAHLTTRLADLRRQFEQDGDWQSFEPRFQAEANRIRAEASSLIRNPALLRRWGPRSEVAVSGALDGVLSRGRRLQSESEYDRLDTVLGSLSTRYADATDDDTRNTIMRNIEDTLALGQHAGIVSPERLRELRRRHLQGAVEADVNARAIAGDGYAALLELREGDPRGQTPSTGQVSETGLSQIQRLLRPPGETLTPAQTRAEQRRLQTTASGISEWMKNNLVGEDGAPIPLTQLQHDALVAYAMSRTQRAGTRGRPEDALDELLPTLRTGSWESVASAIRAGGLTNLEQPAPRTAGAPRTTPSSADLGSVSARYESGGRGVGFISTGQGDPGGQSYGIHQLSGASSMGAFLASPEGEAYRAEFGSARPMTPEFNAIYRQIAERDPEGFAAAQRAFYTRTHYEPARRSAEAAGFDVSNRAIQEALFSIGVQHGGARTIIERAGEQLRAGASVEDQVKALYEARSRYVRGLSTLPENTRQAVLSRYQREERDVLALARGEAPTSAPSSEPDQSLGVLGDMVLGQAPSSRYARLPIERRQAVMRHLSEALRVDMRSEIDSDIEAIRRTGRPRTLPDGTTWLQRAARARVFTPNQLSTLQRRWREAEALFQGLNGLSDMTPDETAARLEQLDTSRVPEGEDYAMAARVGATARRQAEKIAEVRRTDPSRAVSGAYIPGQTGSVRTRPDGSVFTSPDEDDIRIQPAREVTDAYRALARRYSSLGLRVDEDGNVTVQSTPGAPGEAPRPQRFLLTDPRLTQDDRRRIIEARLAAMQRLGVPEDGRFILRADEAASLLNLPSDISTLSQTQFEQRLREASQRATELFGPRHARAAFDAAIHFRRVSGDRQKDAQSFSEQLDRASRARRAALDREEALWSGGAPQPGIPGAPMLGPGGWTETVPGGWISGPSSRPTQSPLDGLQGPLTYTPGFVFPQAGGMEAPTGVPGTGSMRPLQPPSPMTPGRTAPITAPGAGRYPRPSQDDINILAANPQAAQAEFDATFGPGAAAAYLQIYGRR